MTGPQQADPVDVPLTSRVYALIVGSTIELSDDEIDALALIMHRAAQGQQPGAAELARLEVIEARARQATGMPS